MVSAEVKNSTSKNVGLEMSSYNWREEHCRRFNNLVLSTSPQELEALLWELLKEMSVCVYQTFSGLSFKYCIRGGEMFVDRKEKSITKATVMIAFQKAFQIQQEQGCVSGPKKLGSFGASYLYPIFLRIGFITQEKQTSEIII